MDFGVCMQLSGTTDPTDSTLQAALVSAAAAELNVSVSMVTLVHIQSGCGGGGSLVDVGATGGRRRRVAMKRSLGSIYEIQVIRFPYFYNGLVPSCIDADLCK